ncbi:MAG: MurR/RpiR family transcriptional regulator [Streptobacillus sp.]
MSLMIKIRENKDFTENEKYVAEYILKNIRNIRSIPAMDISKNTYTSISTVTRMCKKLGFKGFQEFRLKAIEEMALIGNKEMVVNNSDIDENCDTKDIIEKISKLSIISLKETKMLQDADIIDKIVDLINEKSVIDFYGMGASHIVCLDAQYKFMRVGKIVNTFNGTDLQHVQAINSDENHLAIIVSYSGMTKEILDIVKILKEKGVTTVSITKYVTNAIAKLCDYNLYVTSKESFKRSAAIYSRISILNLIDVIYLAYSNKNYKEVVKRINETKIEKIENQKE